jgi:hypothetical protein
MERYDIDLENKRVTITGKSKLVRPNRDAHELTSQPHLPTSFQHSSRQIAK